MRIIPAKGTCKLTDKNLATHLAYDAIADTQHQLQPLYRLKNVLYMTKKIGAAQPCQLLWEQSTKSKRVSKFNGLAPKHALVPDSWHQVGEPEHASLVRV